MTTAPSIGNAQEQGPPRYWEMWEPPAADLPSGLRDLAGYVAPEALEDVKWGDGLDPGRQAAGAGGEEEMAALLYGRLARQQVAFWRDPWLPDPAARGIRQRIRHPWLLVHGQQQGTCLDFATTYAAMCLGASIPPLIALTLDLTGNSHGHAFVLLTPGRSPHPAAPAAEQNFAPGFGETGSAGVLELISWRRFEGALDAGRALPVDFSTGAGGKAPGFDRAIADAREHLAAAREAGEAMWLVDVAWLQNNGHIAPLEPPATRAPIRRYIPGGRIPIEPLASQRRAIAALADRSGTVAVHGGAGTGKSTVAREIAFGAQFGAAWFLNASDPQALINSLCQAALANDGDGRGRVEDLLDREGFAENARQRLLEADDDWVVVIDNADGDPTKLTRWLPRPNPDRSEGVRQLVLVTTTNPAWHNLQDLPVETLEPAGEDEAAGRLPGPELIDLAAGRPLLFDAFDRLAAATGWDGARIAAARDGDAEIGKGVDAGAATLWGAAVEAIGDERDVLRAAARAAYLPPDGQPLAVHGATGSVRRLADLGVVDIDDGDRSLRMHRLVGAAVRDDLERREPQICDEATQRIASDVEDVATYEQLDDRGDLDTIAHLESWLGQIDGRTDEPSSRLGIAMHGAAQLLELHGHTRRSGELYRKADRHLVDDEKRRARSLHGQARTVNQHHRRDPVRLREALQWSRQAEQMRREADPPAVAASLAMQGLLEQKLADFPGERETTTGLVEKALATLEDAYERLYKQLAESSERETLRLDPELARRYFNLAGIHIRLARARPGEAGALLDRAGEIYADVEARRREIYNRDVHPHIAACVIGRAYVDYFRAVLVPAGREQRTKWLRQATEATISALVMRQAQEGSFDGDEVDKCVDFLLKIAVERRT